jgi:hypothetical protein
VAAVLVAARDADAWGWRARVVVAVRGCACIAAGACPPAGGVTDACRACRSSCPRSV